MGETALVLDIQHIAAWAIAVMAIGALAAAVAKLITRDLKRDIGDTDHRLRNQMSRIDALEHNRTQDVERIVKVETLTANLEKGQERIERTLADMKHDQSEARAEIVDSIRELRDARLK